MEEEHRRILRDALLESSKKRRSFKDHLLSMPNVGDDKDFERGPRFKVEARMDADEATKPWRSRAGNQR